MSRTKNLIERGISEQWESKYDDDKLPIAYDDLEDAFAAVEVKKKEKKEEKKPAVIAIIDPKLGQNTMIFLARYKGKEPSELVGRRHQHTGESSAHLRWRHH